MAEKLGLQEEKVYSNAWEIATIPASGSTRIHLLPLVLHASKIALLRVLSLPTGTSSMATATAKMSVRVTFARISAPRIGMNFGSSFPQAMKVMMVMMVIAPVPPRSLNSTEQATAMTPVNGSTTTPPSRAVLTALLTAGIRDLVSLTTPRTPATVGAKMLEPATYARRAVVQTTTISTVPTSDRTSDQAQYLSRFE